MFVPKLTPGEVTLSGPDAKHLARVLRVKPGSMVTAFDGRGLEAEGEVTNVDGYRVTLRLSAATRSPVENPVDIDLAVALLKGDKLSGVVRQATELGVKSIWLFHSSYSDVRDLSKNKLERLRRIAQEAAKQSGRALIPNINGPVRLAELDLRDFSLCAHPYAETTLKGALHGLSLQSITLITGPEGGFAESDVETLLDRGVHSVSLGPRILRAETAPIALLAALSIWEGK